jgi:hypothetical protein
MHYQKRSFLTLFTLLVVSTTLFSQYRRNRFDLTEGLHIAPMVGANFFFGDLVDKSRTSYSVGVVAEREMTNFLNARASLTLGQMKGKQIAYWTNNLTYADFKNYYGELMVGVSLKPWDLAFGYFRQRTLSPYINGMLGVNFFTTTEWYREGSDFPNGSIKSDLTQVAPVVSIGGGIAYYINSSMKFHLEVHPYYAFNDNLDGHEYWFSNPTDPTKHYTKDNDFYYTAMAGISYTIKDSRWRNEPKYSRKAYLKSKNYNKVNTKKRSSYKRPKRR